MSRTRSRVQVDPDAVFTSCHGTIKTSRSELNKEMGLPRVLKMDDGQFAAFVDIAEYDMEEKGYSKQMAMELEYRTTFNPYYLRKKKK